ncbi:hypothetical protein ACROYT_G043216 [Oculina patagonica]
MFGYDVDHKRVADHRHQEGEQDGAGDSSTVKNNHVCEGRYSFIQFKASAVCFINPLRTGRYVGILTTTNQILQLCEVEVYSRENLAFRKPTVQFSGQYWKGKSSLAVDGNSNTYFRKPGDVVGSCTQTFRTDQPWWRVDLEQEESVSEVYVVNRGTECNCGNRLDNFEIRVGNIKGAISSGGGVVNPKCGGSYSVPVGKGASFFCHPSLKGRYATIRNLKNDVSFTLCEVEVYSERRACPIQGLGVASSDAFPNSRLTASSYSSGNGAGKGRLNGIGAWSPSTDGNANDYLQIELQYEFIICAVATQGKSTADHWTTKYKLQLSLIDDVNNWSTYKENNVVKVFHGNSGRNDIVKHSLMEYASARFIRFQPTTYNSRKALRVEVFGILISAVPSQAPCNFYVAVSSNTSVTASWQLPPTYARHGIIRGFKLFYKKKDSAGSPTVLTYNSTSLSRVVTGLDNSTEYEFQVLSFTSDGDGPKSSIKAVGTVEDVPSKAPDSFSVTASTSTSISVSWQLPPVGFRNGVIRGFKLFYKKKGSSALQNTITINSTCGAILSKDVTGLEKYTEYEFQVLAFTSVGDGPKSFIKVERTNEDVPSQAPSNFTLTASSSTIISASWELLPENARNGVIKGFKLFYKKKGSSVFPTTLVVNNGTSLTTSVTCLDKYTEYEFLVLAFTYVGDGPNSSIVVEKTMEDAPSQPPSNFSVTAKSSTSILASWQLPPADSRNGIIKGFRLFYKKKGSVGTSNFVIISVGGNLTKVVSKLEMYTVYKFQVLAFTSVGDGPNSSVLVERTKEDVPSQPPSNFSVTAKSSTSILASWQLPPADSRNGIIKGFRLFYKKKGSVGTSNFVVISVGGNLTKVVSKLEMYTVYKFQVLAFTSVGDGPNSSVLVERTKEDVPSQPPSNFSVTAKSSTSILVSWQLPPADSRNGIIKGFRLFYKKKGSVGTSNFVVISVGGNLTKVVSKLEMYTVYKFQVLAFTSVGDGPNSSVLVERTKEDVPSQPPSNFSLAVKTSTSILASWQLPPENSTNGIILGFKLFYKKRSSTASITTMLRINDGAALTENVTGLAKYTEYAFQVLAFTSVGDGPNSTVEFGKTKEDAPSQPPNSFSVTAKTSTSITASWQLPPADSRNGIITGFKLFYKKKGSSGSPTMILINSGSGLTKDVTGLDKYTEYEFEVLAFTSVGDGPNSPVEIGKTMEDAPGAPTIISHIDIAPSKTHGPRINLTWSRPAEANGIIRNYTVLYSHEGDTQKETFGSDVFSHLVDVLGGVTYQFHVRAVTIKPGPNASLTVITTEYEPSRGPDNVSSVEVNTIAYQITWTGLSTKVANGIVKLYEVSLTLKENCTLVQPILYSTFNTTTTDVLLTGLSLCAKYEVSVRGYTVVGPGPYSKPVVLQTVGVKWSKEAPYSLSFAPVSSETGITAKITLPRFPGSAKFFQVIIITFSSNYSGVVNSPESFAPQDLLTYEEAHESSAPAAYVTFQFGGNDFNMYQEFIVGNGAQSNSKTRNKRSSDIESYYNKALQPNTNYRVFLRAFVNEILYISSNFIEIETKEKPVTKKLPIRTMLSVGELAILTCEVSGDPDPTVTWTKNGSTSIPRAQFKNDSRILLIQNVLPQDSGAYECKASNKFGDSRTATIVEVTEKYTSRRHRTNGANDDRITLQSNGAP